MPRVHRRTFFLTVAQLIIIVRAVLILMTGIAAVGLGVYALVAGREKLSTLPGYDRYFTQFGEAVLNAAIAFFIVAGAILIVIGVIDLLLGIFVGRPSNVARWIIIVLDVLTAAGLLSRLSAHLTDTGALILVVLLGLKAIVFYALVLDPATRRNFAGTMQPGVSQPLIS
jgi:hypothetical protein